MSKELQKWYAHIDLDAFFASVEQMDHPEYKGKPVIVGGRPEDRRGVVSTASYEARKFGVHSAMPTYQAYKLCPQGIFLHGNYKRYSELSYKIMTIFKDFSPEVDQMSIDEAFIDLTGTEKLFGPPEETCLKIKERVKKETGLTVSIGLASTKYVAKICSGYKKPDGFYKVEPGEETSFMLNLPLEKVWGIGEKTLSNLHQKGIFSTRDIYEKDIQTLTFIFGPNTAGFLYDVVRGGKNEVFRKESKTHSISAERTFPFDLIDNYTLETEILELAQDVMFRLLKEKGFSRTAFLKLRYEDFSTVTIQRTLDQNIKTLDSFYEILTILFKEKREKGRGIRLLGVGFENVDNEDKPEQQSLFDDNTKKKQQVEKAILQLSQKHPEIKVQKARTLKTTIIVAALFSGLLCNFNHKLWAENITTNQGAGTILSDTLTIPAVEKNQYFKDDADSIKSFEYDLTGYWNIDFSGNLISTFGNKTPFGFSFGTPVFKQEIELSSWILFNNHWYFDTSFADGFEKNSFTAGYKNGKYINAAQLSNRNIGMHNDYSASYFGFGLKDGKNQAPGLAIQFLDIKNSKWKGDLMLRYDMTNSKKAVFYGMNNVTDLKIELNSFIYGKKFIFPASKAELLSKIKAVYVENPNGNYKDSNQKKYIKLSSSKYSILNSLSELNFTADAKTGKQGNSIPSILITFTDDSAVTEMITATGDFNNKETFAGQIQELFNTESKSKIDLNKFSYNLENYIDNSKALVIQNSTGFSPYLCANIYDCGANLASDINVISQTTELPSEILTAVEIQENDTLMEDYFNESHLYSQLICISQENTSLQLPKNRYPLGQWNPFIYLNLTTSEDAIIQVRNYSQVNSLQIGTKAIDGTVYAYKNGILDLGAKYNSDTGSVTLSSIINDTDRIIIYYQEDSEDFSGGALAAGLGFVYNFTPDFTWDISATTRYPISLNQQYSTVNTKSNGFSALTSGLNYNKNNFQISDKLAISVQNPDQTGTLLAHSNDFYINQTYYLSYASGYKTKSVPLINNNYLDEELNCTFHMYSGIQDSYISGYAIPLFWDFSNKSTEDNCWASVDIKLDYGNLLVNSSCFEFAIKPQFDDITDLSNYELYLQLGILASENNLGEDASYIRTWNLTSINSKTTDIIDLTNPNWQTAKIILDDYDRAFLTSNNDARLILLRKKADAENLKGRIFAGPYQPYVQSIYTEANPNISIQTYTDLTDSSPSAEKLKISKNYSTKVKWNLTSEIDELNNETEITAISYFPAADFSNYKTINLDFAIEALEKKQCSLSEDSALTLILDRDSTSNYSDGKIALKLELYDIQNYIHTSLKYHTLTINVSSEEVYLDDYPLDLNQYRIIELNKNIQPSRQKLIFNLNQNGNFYSKGNIYINNLYYSNTTSYAQFQNNFNVNYKKQGTIVKINDYELLKDGFIKIDSNQNVTTLNDVSIDSTVEGGITAFNIKLQSDVRQNFSKNEKENFITQAGHNIQTNTSLFNVLDFNESYRYDKNNSSLSKNDSAILDFNKIGLKFSTKANGSENQNLRTQNILLNQNYNHLFGKITFNFDTSITTNQKINNRQAGNNPFNTNNYFKGWYDISTLQFSKGETSASNRNVNYKINSGLNFSELNIFPKFEYGISSAYQNASENKYLLNQNLNFNVPFKIKKQTFSFTYNKSGNDSIISNINGNYFTDSELLFKNYVNDSYFFKAIPVWELFSYNIVENLSNKNNSKLFSAYSSKYEFEWKRPLFNSLADLYIPGSSKFIIERDSKVSESISDIYQLKLSINNSAVNNFGSKAPKPVYTWFESDELLSSLTAIVKIPADTPSGTNYNLSWYIQFLIFITEKSTLSTALDFQIDTNNTWNGKTTIIYSRPSNQSFLVTAAKYVVPKLDKITFNITQKDTGNIQIGKTETQHFTQFDYLHTSSINFLKNFSIDFGLGSTFTWNQLTASSLAVNFSVSGKMKF